METNENNVTQEATTASTTPVTPTPVAPVATTTTTTTATTTTPVVDSNAPAFNDLIPDGAESVDNDAAESAPVEEVVEDDGEYVNLAGIDPDDVKLLTITQDDITRYLQNLVGVPFHCDYTRWDGARDNAYVLMRVIVRADLVSTKMTAKIDNPIMAASIEANAGDSYMSEEVYNALSPFMYPKSMESVNLRPDFVDYLNRIGLTADRYNKYVKEFVEPRPSTDRKTGIRYFVLVLQADEIIKRMINVNPRNGKPYGEFEVIAVHGGDQITDGYGTVVESTPIVWKCTVSINKDSSYNGTLGISFNEMFANAIINK